MRWAALLLAVTLTLTLPRYCVVERCVVTGVPTANPDCVCVTCVDSLTTIPVHLSALLLVGVKAGTSEHKMLGLWTNVAGKEGLTLVRTVTLPDTTRPWSLYALTVDAWGTQSKRSNILNAFSDGRMEVCP